MTRRGSVLPTPDDPRGPCNCKQLCGDVAGEDGPLWPWLRLSVDAGDQTYGGGGHATVVLTKHQATRLRDALTYWIGRAE